MSLQSSQLIGFPNRIAFLALPPCHLKYWMLCSEWDVLGLGNKTEYKGLLSKEPLSSLFYPDFVEVTLIVKY